MKKNRKILVYSLAGLLALGGISTLFGCTASKANDVSSSPLSDEIGADGTIDFTHHILNADAPAAGDVNSILGVQVLAGQDDAHKSLRFVAALKDYSSFVSASFTRVVKDEAGADYKASAKFPVATVYTSVADAGTVQWSVALDASYIYYMVYTLRNIPLADYFYTVNVDFVATPSTGDALSATQQAANVQGVLGDPSKNVKYVAVDETAKTYGAQAVGTSITEAVVSPYAMTVAGYVATKMGTVTTLSMRDSSDGAFDSCTALTSLVLPDTITEFTKYAFYNCEKLTTMTFPKALTSIAGSNCFNNNVWGTLYYNADALVNSSDVISFDLDKVVVSKDVTSLPDSLISSSAKVGEVDYGGTTAQWTALEGTKNNGLDIDNVICSDTVKVDVTYHFAGASLTVNGAAQTDTYIASVVVGKAMKDPGKPVLASKLFRGWFSDEALTTSFDFATVITAAIDLYAKFEDYPAGTNIETAIVLSDGNSGAMTASVELPIYYYKFTAAAADTYYFSASDILSNGASSTDDYKLRIYDSTKAEITSYSYSYDPTSIEAVFGDSTGSLRVTMAAGDTYYFSIEKNSALTGSDTYGATVHFATKANDTPDTAAAYTFGTEQAVLFDDKSDSLFYSFTASETATKYFKCISVGSIYYSFTLYKGGTTLTKVASVSGISTSGKAVDLEKDAVYYVMVTTNDVTSTTKTISFTFAAMPAGTIASNPLTLAVDAAAITVANQGMNYTYYSLAITVSATYRLILGGGSQYYQKTVDLLDSTGATTLASAKETGTTSSSGWGEDDTYYGTTFELDYTMAVGTYLVKVGYPASTNGSGFTLQCVTSQPGDNFASAIAYDWTQPSVTLDATTTDKYYTFTADVAGTFTLTLTPASGTVTLILYEADQKTKITTITSSAHFDVTAETIYYFDVKGSEASSVAIAKEAYASPLSGKAFLGTYMGCCKGISYYKMSITAEGLSWEGGSTLNEVTITSENATTGISVLASTISSDAAVITTDGIRAFVTKGTNYYFLSKNCTDYDSGSIDGQEAKTASASLASGVIIDSVAKTTDSTREYVLVKDGVIYLNVTIDFTAGADITDSACAFTAKASDGTLIGTYTGASSTLTAA